MSAPIENPFESISNTVAFWPGDWAQDKRLAWLYGIVSGWDEAIEEVAAKHGWDTGTVARLQRLRERYARIANSYGGTEE